MDGLLISHTGYKPRGPRGQGAPGHKAFFHEVAIKISYLMTTKRSKMIPKRGKITTETHKM